MARILIVDDEAGIRKALTRKLTDKGHMVEARPDVANALVAISAARVANLPYDLVLSDVDMPGKSGVDLVNMVKAHFPETPIVLFTGGDARKVAAEAGVPCFDKTSIDLDQVIITHSSASSSSGS